MKFFSGAQCDQRDSPPVKHCQQETDGPEHDSLRQSLHGAQEIDAVQAALTGHTEVYPAVQKIVTSVLHLTGVFTPCQVTALHLLHTCVLPFVFVVGPLYQCSVLACTQCELDCTRQAPPVQVRNSQSAPQDSLLLNLLRR